MTVKSIQLVAFYKRRVKSAIREMLTALSKDCRSTIELAEIIGEGRSKADVKSASPFITNLKYNGRESSRRSFVSRSTFLNCYFENFLLLYEYGSLISVKKVWKQRY